MSGIIGEMLSYQFMVRALIVGILVSLCAALLGVSLVLKRFSMIGDGLSHVGFGALALAAALNIAPLALAVPVVVLAAFLLLRINKSSRINGDAAIALISSSALAVGVIVISVTTGMNADVSSYMFGSILSLSGDDAVLSIVLSVVVLCMFVFLYPRIFAVTFDEDFARATGTKAELYNSVIAVLTAVTVVLGMRMMGALLISSLIVFPALSSMRLCRSFRSVVICSGALAVLCFVLGMTASFAFELPSGASVVAVNIVALTFGELLLDDVTAVARCIDHNVARLSRDRAFKHGFQRIEAVIVLDERQIVDEKHEFKRIFRQLVKDLGYCPELILPDFNNSQALFPQGVCYRLDC